MALQAGAGHAPTFRIGDARILLSLDFGRGLIHNQLN